MADLLVYVPGTLSAAVGAHVSVLQNPSNPWGPELLKELEPVMVLLAKAGLAAGQIDFLWAGSNHAAGELLICVRTKAALTQATINSALAAGPLREKIGKAEIYPLAEHAGFKNSIAYADPRTLLIGRDKSVLASLNAPAAGPVRRGLDSLNLRQSDFWVAGEKVELERRLEGLSRAIARTPEVSGGIAKPQGFAIGLNTGAKPVSSSTGTSSAQTTAAPAAAPAAQTAAPAAVPTAAPAATAPASATPAADPAAVPGGAAPAAPAAPAAVPAVPAAAPPKGAVISPALTPTVAAAATVAPIRADEAAHVSPTEVLIAQDNAGAGKAQPNPSAPPPAGAAGAVPAGPAAAPAAPPPAATAGAVPANPAAVPGAPAAPPPATTAGALPADPAATTAASPAAVPAAAATAPAAGATSSSAKSEPALTFGLAYEDESLAKAMETKLKTSLKIAEQIVASIVQPAPADGKAQQPAQAAAPAAAGTAADPAQPAAKNDEKGAPAAAGAAPAQPAGAAAAPATNASSNANAAKDSGGSELQTLLSLIRSVTLERDKQHVKVSVALTPQIADYVFTLLGDPAGAAGATPISDGIFAGTLTTLGTATQQWQGAKPEALHGAKLIGELPLRAGYSWLTELLPYVGHNDLYRRFDLSKSWTDNVNRQLTAEVVPAFLNPMDPRMRWSGYPFGGMALTHFVGMSGVEDRRNVVAAALPRSDPRAGIFGYSSIAKPAEITDGTSQTIMIIGSGQSLVAPWVQGGGATVRGARAPYFDKLSGFGSVGAPGGGTFVMFADGSTRMISSTIDPEVFKAMCTMHGAEKLDLSKSVTQRE